MKYLKKFSGEEEYQEYLNNPEELDTPHVGLIDNETKKLRYQPTCKFGYTIYTQEPQVIDVIPSSFFDLGDGKLSEDLFYNNSNSTLTLNFSESGDGGKDYFIQLPGFRYWVEEQRTKELSYSMFDENLFFHYGISTQSLPSFLGFFPSFDSLDYSNRELNPMILFYDIRMNYNGEDVADYDVWGYSLGNAAVNQWLIDNNAEGDEEYMNEHFSELLNIYYSPIKLAVQNYLSSHTLAQIAAPITVIDEKGNEQEFSKVSPYVISYLGMTQKLHPDWTWSQVVSQCWEMLAPKSLYWTFDTFFEDFNENSKFSAYTTSLLLTPDETDETYLTSFRYLISLNGFPSLRQYIVNNQYTDPDTGELTITQEELEDLIGPAIDSYIQEHFSTSDTLEERKSNVVQVLCEICGAEYVLPTNSPIKTVLIDGEEIEIKTELTVSSFIGTVYGNALYYFEPGIHEITLVTSSFIKDGNYFSGLGDDFGILGIKYPHTWNTIDVNELNSINFLKTGAINNDPYIIKPGSEYISQYSIGGGSITIGEISIPTMEIPPSRVEYGENIKNIIQGEEDINGIFGKDIDLVIKDKRYKVDRDHQLVLKGGRLELVYGSSSLTSLPIPTDANFIITSISPTAFPNCKIEVDSYEVPEGITKLETGSLHHICLNDGFVLVLPSTVTSLEPGIFHPDSSSNGAIIFNSNTPPSGFADFLGESGKLFYVVQEEDNYSTALGKDHPNITLTNDVNGAINALRYLVFDILSPGTITINYDGSAPTGSGYYLSYKLNKGDWVKLTGTDIINLSLEVKKGDSILWEGNALRGYASSGSYFYRSKFSTTCEFEVYGSLKSLMYNNSGGKLTEVPKGGFYELFSNCTGLTSAKNLILPKSLNSGGYNFYRMFYGCTSLVEAPEISVDIAETYAFSYMFSGCTQLTISPKISATRLKNYSCNYMFYASGLKEAEPITISGSIDSYACNYMFSSCNNLEVSPVITVGTTIESYAFNYAFQSCNSLTTVSSIVATTAKSNSLSGLFQNNSSLVEVGDISVAGAEENSLRNMFLGCTSLTDVGKITIIEVGNNALYQMFGGCTALTTAPVLLLSNLSPYSCYRMFSGCTSLTKVPELSVITLAEGCFQEMFSGCTSLIEAPKLPTTILANGCYYNMFSGCTALIIAPELPATTLADSCYRNMFNSCTSLTEAPELPATTLADSCYRDMFRGCTSLTKAPELPATTLEYGCYMSMFYGCTNLTTVPTTLPATTLANYCYNNMFYDCTSLTIAPSLPATTLAQYCYQSMFKGCTALEETPELPATILTRYCYYGMFENCSSLTNVGIIRATTYDFESCGEMFKNCTSLIVAPSLSATTLAGECYRYMFEGCTALTEAPELPATTLAQNCYSSMFRDCTSLTRASELPATTLEPYCYASMFQGCTSLEETPELPATILADSCYYGMFSGCTALTTVSDISATTLAQYCYREMFKGCTALEETPELPATTLAQFCYNSMFEECTALTTISSMAATTLANGCYKGMFSGCTSLTQAPTLPVTSLSDYCYLNMFENCTSLTTLPTLSAPTLSIGCYKGMFKGCTSLTSVPTNYLPVTTLTNYCYAGMFMDCTSLTQAPNLPATVLAENCYGSNESGGSPTGINGMFRGCTSLVQAPSLPATTLANNCYCGMFMGCTSLTSVPTNYLPVTTLTNYCYSYMFYGCTALTQAPELPSTTLANHCYYYMFSGCTLLTTAPELSATTLANSCYSGMFSNCTSLNYIKMLATSISGASLTNWVYNVSSGGTFIMNSEAMWYVTGNSGIPSGWTLQFDGDSTIAEDYINVISTGYLCFEAIEDGTFTLTIPYNVSTSYITSISYSLDEGQTWTTRDNTNSTVTITTPTVQAGNKIYWKGVGSKFCSNYTSSSGSRSVFSSTGQFNISGYIMSLLNGDGNYVDLTASIDSYAFSCLFYNNTKVVSAEYLKLPKTVNTYCYYSMFYGCTALTTAPALPATTLTQGCYQYMFYGCSSLTTAPATLPATTLASYCYGYMFYNCSNLTTAPILPASTLVSNCYNYMFYNCKNLNYVKALFTTTPGYSYTYYWLSGVKSSGTFVKHTNATWTTTGIYGVPSGWTIERASE